MRGPTVDLSRENRFDLLRFLLATVVVYSHSYTLFARGATDPLRTWTGGTVYVGAACVDGFFAMSGFLVTASWFRSGRPREYLRNRVLRVVPGFAVAFVVSVALGIACSSAPGRWFDAENLLRLVMLRGPKVEGAFPDNVFPGQVNGSMWTIAPEAAHYLILLALATSGALRRGVVGTVFAAAVVLYALDVRLSLPWPMRETPRFTAFFFAGIAFHFLGERARRGTGPLLLAALLLAAGFLDVRLFRFALPTAAAYLLLRVGLTARGRFDPTRHGDVSYGLYLYSFPVQQVLLHVASDRLVPTTLFVLSFAISLPLAAASWLFVERPFLRRKSRGASEPRSVPEAVPPGAPRAGTLPDLANR
jgi:peptidoglycan/LPS O-acetylase OafA/YrhL